MIRRTLRRHGEVVVLIAIGGILGSNLRYVSGAVAGDALLVTVVVNTLGSLGLGLLLFDARADALLPERLRHMVGTGVLASFTTYSTFVADIAASEPVVAGSYIVISYAAGFTGVLASRKIVAARTTARLAPPAMEDD